MLKYCLTFVTVNDLSKLDEKSYYTDLHKCLFTDSYPNDASCAWRITVPTNYVRLNNT